MDGTRVPFPQYGVDVVYGTQGTERVRLLEPRTGSVFTIQTQDQNGPDLAPGTYKVLGLSGGKVRFATSPGTDAALVGRDLHFVVTLLDVQPGQPPAIPSGQYGVRASPQVLGDVSPFIRHDEAAAQTTATAR
jgi:hypothetical protein